MVDLLKAEYIKLTSTRSPWWCTAFFIVLGLGITLLSVSAVRSSLRQHETSPATVNAELAVIGIAGGFSAIYLVMVLATLTATSEYRSGVIRTTFLACSSRSLVLTAKAVLTGVAMMIIAFLIGIFAFMLVKGMLGGEGGVKLEFSGETWSYLIGAALFTFLCAVLAVGVGALLRHSAGAISLLLLWPLVAETILGRIGNFGRNVTPLLPFANANHFFGAESDITGGGRVQWHWGPWGGLAYFAVFVAVVFGAALVVVNQRDA
ncbi:ABC transporter permease [Nocardia sp. CA-107356]|uniref:ABC transporter permease n=1 Tax=Nocardia sp. CA-107356 TaxID=3239972 RepID=UPI003D89DA88